MIPAVVVSGFLGSGKTTLVRHLLADAKRSGVRLAVVSNEFGELGIDRELLADPGEEYVEIEGGCVCCRLSDELVVTLQNLWERVKPDRIVIETSGVALPYDVQLNFWREPVAAWVDDDVAVVVVNAEQVAEGRDLAGTFEQQVSSADLLLLNQVDRVSGDALLRAEALLREIEPDAPIVRSTHSDLDPALLFPPDPERLRARRRAAAEPAPPHTHESFAVEEVEVAAGVEPEALVERLRAARVLRAKGFVVTSAGPRLVQGVGSRVELTPLEREPRPGVFGRVVVIRRAGPADEAGADLPEGET